MKFFASVEIFHGCSPLISLHAAEVTTLQGKRLLQSWQYVPQWE
jgi:hypothetical protein